MNKLKILLIFFVISTQCIKIRSNNPYQGEFDNWCMLNAKKYLTPQQYLYRLKIFIQNKEIVDNHNEKYHNGETSYTMKLNKFADMTKQEYISLYTSLNFSKKILNTNTMTCIGGIIDNPDPPAQLDWSNKAVVDPMDEGTCGSNWAITAIGAIEGLNAIKKGKLTRFSTQQLVDCSFDYGNEGCDGGFMDQAFWYVVDNGITTQQIYPYEGKFNKRCKYSPSMKVAGIERCANVPTQKYNKLISAISQQPTSVAVDSSGFQFYNNGIYDGNCTTQINRGMLLVGYGGSNTTMFWKLKNSKGTNWGDKGFILISRKQQDGPGTCGIQLAASVPQFIQ